MRHEFLFPVLRICAFDPPRLGNSSARPVIRHRESEQTIARTSRRLLLLYKFDWHTSPIIQNFHSLGLVVGEIPYEIIKEIAAKAMFGGNQKKNYSRQDFFSSTNSFVSIFKESFAKHFVFMNSPSIKSFFS